MANRVIFPSAAILVLPIMLSGCSMLIPDPAPSSAAESVATPPRVNYTPDSRDKMLYTGYVLQPIVTDRVHHRFVPSATHKTLNDYASQLAMKLLSDSHQLTSETRIGVASFVTFDKSLRNPTIAGNQLSEHLVSQMQSLGVNVVDFKVAKTMIVNDKGDLVLSRKMNELATSADIHAVLTGTLMQSPSGIEVNARIVTVKQHRLLASSQLFIPGFMLVDPHRND